MYSHFYFSIDLKIGTNCMKLTGYMAIYKVYQTLTDLGYSFNCTTWFFIFPKYDSFYLKKIIL
jgi:hypothetical protein